MIHTKEELKAEIKTIKDTYKDLTDFEIERAKQWYLKNASKYQIGDVIYNVCGIIEITEINITNQYTIQYLGKRLKWLKGGSVTYAKNKKLNSIIDYGDIKLLDKKKIK